MGPSVNGHSELPTAGQGYCPSVANKGCPVADMNLPMRRWLPPAEPGFVRSRL